MVDFFGNDVSLQKTRDCIKDRLCKEHGVTLIRVSYKDKNRLESAVLEALDGIF